MKQLLDIDVSDVGGIKKWYVHGTKTSMIDRGTGPLPNPLKAMHCFCSGNSSVIELGTGAALAGRAGMVLTTARAALAAPSTRRWAAAW